jgi:hypothetical protein
MATEVTASGFQRDPKFLNVVASNMKSQSLVGYRYRLFSEIFPNDIYACFFMFKHLQVQRINLSNSLT